MESNATKFTPMQLELLRIFARNPSEQELQDLKDLITKYYAGKLRDEVDKIQTEKGTSAKTVEEWAHMHFRTPYQPEQRSDEKVEGAKNSSS